jgi:hypothetical protein
MTETKSYTIYLFGPSPEGKYYVGQTDNLERRIRDHEYAAGSSPRFHAAICRFGLDAIPLKVITETNDQEEADRLEILNISKHNCLWPNGYNMTLGGKATRFDPKAKVEGFKEAEVQEGELFAEATARLAGWRILGICPACGRESLNSPCASCGVAHVFGEVVLTHFVTKNTTEVRELPWTARLVRHFRLSRDSDYFIDLVKSRLGKGGKIPEIIPVVGTQYANQLLPYMHASLRRAVLVKRGEPTFSLGRFNPCTASKSDIRWEISINRHLRRNHKSLGVSFAKSVEVYRWAYSKTQEGEESARFLTDKILMKNGASRLELDEAARDAFLIQRLEIVAGDEKRKFLPQEPEQPATPNDDQSLTFVIRISSESNQVYDENLFADELGHFSAISDKPQLILIHRTINPDQILVIEFDTHNQRREFVNRLVGITPSERLLYLKKGQFDEIGITSFLVDRPNCLGGSGTLENISEDEEKPEEDTPAS